MKICPVCRYCYEDTEAVCASGDHGALVPSRHGSCVIAEKYRLVRLLGRGGMGAVYVGTHIELERPTAIKLLLPDLLSDLQALERFRREARAAARLNHPNVADTYDYGILPGGEAYIVMELVEGQTLREYINAAGMLSCAEAVTITRQVADGVEVAHRNGIIHRDLKPSNIILSRDHHDALLAKVVDFGIAKLKEYSSTGGGVLTSTGSLVGTPRYMSPEQCAGHEIDARSDIYSLGVILYEMLAGHPPFDAPTATAIAIKHVQEAPRPIQELRPEVPDALARLVMQTLLKDPSARPQTAAEFARGLRPIEAQMGAHERAEHLHLSNEPAAISNASPASAQTPASPHPLGPRDFSFADTDRINSSETSDSLWTDERGTNRAGLPTIETGPLVGDVSSDEDDADGARKEVEVEGFGAREMEVAAQANVGGRASEESRNETTPDVSPALPSGPETVTHVAAAPVQQATPATDADALSNPERAIPGAAAEEAGQAEKRESGRRTATPVRATAPPAAPPHPSHTTVPAPHLQASAPRYDKRPGRSALLIYAGIALAVVIGLAALFFAAGRKSAPRSAGDGESSNVSSSAPTGAPNEVAQQDGRPREAATPEADANNANNIRAVSPADGFSPDEERRALRAALDAWIAATNARDIERQMSFYMPTLSTYYRDNNVSRAFVRRDKTAVIGQAHAVAMSVDEPSISVSRDGRSASMLFRKQYAIDGGVGGGRGEVLQELLWRKTDGGWKIAGERDRRIIR